MNVSHRIPERLGRLAGQRAAGSVGNRAGDDDRKAAAAALEVRFQREQGGLAVQRVEDRLDEKEIRSALRQSIDRLAVGRDQLIEADIARARIVDVGRNRRRSVGGTQRAGDESRLAGHTTGPVIGTFAGNFRCGEVDVPHAVLELVVGLRDRRRVESIGLDDVGAGFEIRIVNFADDVWLRKDEDVVVALDVVRMPREACTPVSALVQPVALDHRAHCAIHDENPLREQRGEKIGSVRLHGDTEF